MRHLTAKHSPANNMAHGNNATLFARGEVWFVEWRTVVEV